MASVAEGLIFGETTSTPVVGLALLHLMSNRAAFGANDLRRPRLINSAISGRKDEMHVSNPHDSQQPHLRRVLHLHDFLRSRAASEHIGTPKKNLKFVARFVVNHAYAVIPASATPAGRTIPHPSRSGMKLEAFRQSLVGKIRSLRVAESETRNQN
jgi:hypothetical protein